MLSPKLSRGGELGRRLLARLLTLGAAALATVLLAACNNSPYPSREAGQNILFNAFQERSPRYLDPTASYNNNETPITYQVYEPLYAYHYLKRPYALIPKVAEEIAHPKYYDKDGHLLPDDVSGEQVAESVYEIHIKKGILYAPHPAFAKDEQGNYLYHKLKPGELGDKHSPWDFPKQGTRELVADDFVYAFKRHATPRIEAPIYGIFSEYIVGLKDYGKLIRAEDRKLLGDIPASSEDKPFLDFRKFPLEGVTAPDPYTLRMRIKGKYPQWKYWLAMTFSAPVPWEADKFYSQPGMAAAGLRLTRWPVGTGPYMLTEYVQDRSHTLKRNPNYRGEPYPCEGEPGDKAAGLLEDCGKMMPFVDTIVSTIEKEKVPMKEKFRQGYLDVPEIERPDWGPEFIADRDDSDDVKKQFEERGFQFPQMTDINNWYLGFNWLDPVVGKGDTPAQQLRNRKLRQAISIAIDWEEGYGRIFRNKGGVAAHSPLPPGVFGSREDQPGFYDHVTHKLVDGKVVRRSIDEAKQLLAEAGYPDGRDAKTGQPLVLNYDYQRVPTPEIKAELDWMVKQFAKIDIQLEIRATDYNQFNEKVLKGKQQIFWWGWLADYPDAENFLFLLYGPNSQAKYEGQNTANYQNDDYDRMYRQLQLLEDGPEKQKLIDQMVAVVQQDAPWAWGYFPYSAIATQHWVHNGKPTIIVRDMAKYYRLDPKERVARLAAWNKPVWWPLLALVAIALGLVWIARRSYRAREQAVGRAPAAVATQEVETASA
ncbi:MAG TPA: ABC transporter substrate-binding protein [Methylibium sp.]